MSAEAYEKLTDASAKLAADLDRKYFRRMQVNIVTPGLKYVSLFLLSHGIDRTEHD